MGFRPRDIQRKPLAMPSSDEKSNILFNVSFSKSGCGGEGGGYKKCLTWVRRVAGWLFRSDNIANSAQLELGLSSVGLRLLTKMYGIPGGPILCYVIFLLKIILP